MDLYSDGVSSDRFINDRPKRTLQIAYERDRWREILMAAWVLNRLGLNKKNFFYFMFFLSI